MNNMAGMPDRLVTRILRSLVWMTAVLTAFLQLDSPVAAAPGDLLISPVRVILEGRQRSAELTLVNRGEDTSTYRIEVENRRMLEDGRFENADRARDGELFADQMIRYAPRRITLEPGTPQTIRVLLRKPAGLDDGEYRTHLLFRAVPKASDADSIESAAGEDDDELSIRLIPVYGVTIPIIVREGDLDAEVKIDKAEILPAAGESDPRLALFIKRSGTRSVYGNIEIRRPGVSGEAGVIAQIRGLAVYTPNDSRRVEVPLNRSLANAIRGQRVEVTFTDVGPEGNLEMARAQVMVP